MSRRKKDRTREQKKVEFDMTPMIDVVFMLLILFIVAMIGMVVRWTWEGVGGALVVGGMLALYGFSRSKFDQVRLTYVARIPRRG